MQQVVDLQASKQFQSILKPDQWKALIGRIASIPNPEVPTKPSSYSLKTGKPGHKHANAGD